MGIRDPDTFETKLKIKFYLNLLFRMGSVMFKDFEQDLNILKFRFLQIYDKSV